jgi:hypothetical protein
MKTWKQMYNVLALTAKDREIWKSSKVSINTKLRLFKSYVLTFLLYCAEFHKITIAISNKICSKLDILEESYVSSSQEPSSMKNSVSKPTHSRLSCDIRMKMDRLCPKNATILHPNAIRCAPP